MLFIYSLLLLIGSHIYASDINTQADTIFLNHDEKTIISIGKDNHSISTWDIATQKMIKTLDFPPTIHGSSLARQTNLLALINKIYDDGCTVTYIHSNNLEIKNIVAYDASGSLYLSSDGSRISIGRLTEGKKYQGITQCYKVDLDNRNSGKPLYEIHDLCTDYSPHETRAMGPWATNIAIATHVYEIENQKKLSTLNDSIQQKTILSCWYDEDTIIRTDGNDNTSLFSENVLKKTIEKSATDLPEIINVAKNPHMPPVYTYDIQGYLKEWDFQTSGLNPTLMRSNFVKQGYVTKVAVGKSLVAILFGDGNTHILKK